MFTALADLARRIGYSRIAVDWLLRSDIGQVIKTIVDDEAFPDYAMPKKTAGRKKPRRKQRKQ
jgi:hypothetical protein